MLVDEAKGPQWNLTKRKDNSQQKRSSSTDTPRNQVVKKSKLQEGVVTPPEIPGEYKEYESLFQEETTTAALPKHQPWDHGIKLQPGKKPGFGPIYSLSEKELQVLCGYLDENLKKGFIRELQSPAGYPILFARKKDGSLQLCINYQKLNNITVKNQYPLPNANKLQDRISKTTIFTKLDLRGAYNLIQMKEGEEWKTVFRTHYGHYEYLVMPFRLTNALATCQALVNNVIRAHLNLTAITYLDNILVYLNTQWEHTTHVKDVLRCLQQAGLKLKPEKCEFNKPEVEFLRYIIGINGIRMDHNKIMAIQD